MKPIVYSLLFVLLGISCGAGSNQENSYADENMYDNKATEYTEEEADVPQKEIYETKKKIVKDGRIGLNTEDIYQSKIWIDELIKKYEGYYSEENFSNSDWSSVYDLNIRVPSGNFEKLIADIESGNTELLYKRLEARDVTEQFMGFEIRLDNKTNYLNRYRELLKQAKSVSDILEIEEKIRFIEEEIDYVTGQLNYLKDQISYSTLDLSLQQEKEYKYKRDKQDNFFERLKESVFNGWHSFVSFFLFTVRLWPFWILIVLLLFIRRKFLK